MAIQFRRGDYADFDPDQMVAGEPAVVQSGDSTTTTGKGVYVCFTPGDVQRLATYEEMTHDIETAMEGSQAIQTYIQAEVDAQLEEHPEWTTTVQDGAITTAKLDSSAVTTAKIADGAVTADKLGSDAFTGLSPEAKTVSYGTVTTARPTLYVTGYVGVLNIVVQLPAGTYNNTSAMWSLPSGMTPKADFRFICDVGGNFTMFVVTTGGAIRPNSTFTLSSAAWIQGEAVFLI